MDWRTLEGDHDLEAFVNAAVELYRPLYERLSPTDRPCFNDYWLRRFNDTRAYLLEDGARAMAMVTVPLNPDVHSWRWGIRTLAYHEALQGAISLPSGVGLDRAITLMSPSGTVPDAPIISGTTHEPVQLSYVRSLVGAVPDAPDERAPFGFRAARPGELEAILALEGRAHANLRDGSPDLPGHREELRQILELGAGWCFVAPAPDDDTRLIAMASYVVHPLQLVGVPVVLVVDVAVDAEWRRRGVARNLQRFAYAHFRDAGYRWAYGNIDPANLASRGQAEAVGLAVWFQAVRFRAT